MIKRISRPPDVAIASSSSALANVMKARSSPFFELDGGEAAPRQVLEFGQGHPLDFALASQEHQVVGKPVFSEDKVGGDRFGSGPRRTGQQIHQGHALRLP